MNIRAQIKKRLTFEQRRRIIRAWVELRATFAPGRIRARNLPKLPNRRKWRTDLSNALLWSCQGGTLAYQYRDIPMLKQPFEVALYMRLIWETKPGTIIEIGTHPGGAAVWMSDLLETFGIDGQIVSIDLQPPAPAYHPRNVSFMRGDAHDLAPTLLRELLAQFRRPWLIIEDAEHHYKSTLAVMRFFDPLLQAGEYLVMRMPIFCSLVRIATETAARRVPSLNFCATGATAMKSTRGIAISSGITSPAISTGICEENRNGGARKLDVSKLPSKASAFFSPHSWKLGA